MSNNKIRVAITQGDTNGIGFELIFKTFAEPEMLEICTPIIYGSPKVAAYHSKALNAECQFSIIKQASEARDGRVNLLACSDEDIKVDMGRSTQESQSAAMTALDKALTDARDQQFDVLVCGPSDMGTAVVNGVKHSSLMKFIETSVGDGNELMPVYIGTKTRLIVACERNINNIASALSTDAIAQKARTLHTTLRRDFMLSNPRIAILALNPTPGKEEQEVIAPAIAMLDEEKIKAFGPYKADTFFANREYEAFDGIIAMYHDQGIIPVKMLSDNDSFVHLANMPVVCTMPDMDSHLTNAGKGTADPASMRNAIYAGIDIVRHRAEYDLPYTDPLPKLYHERPDSGEKLRFSIPKKKEE